MLQEPYPLVSLIIPTRNRYELTRVCIDSILERTRYPNYEILIVDNGSDDPRALEYFHFLSKERNIRILRDDRPFNFSALNNAAVGTARGSIIGLINNDVEVIAHDWMEEMASHACRPEVGAVGAKLWYPDDTLQHGGVILGLYGLAGHSQRGLRKGHKGYLGRANLVQTYSAVTAACLFVRKELYLQVGGLDEDNLGIAFNDVDNCLRLGELGFQNVWTPYAELYHYESARRGYDVTREEKARFSKECEHMKNRWGRHLRNDPAYSPNLTLDDGDFCIAFPPRIAHVL